MVEKCKPKDPHKFCFSKKLMIADYVVLLLLIIAFGVFSVLGYDVSTLGMVIVAWIAQIAISSGAYYWKAKSENLIKMPVLLLKDLPEDMREKADPNQIIASVLGIGTNSN